MLGSRDGFRMGDAKIVDSMIVDGLWDVYNQYHMGITAENVAKAHGIDRAAQDALAGVMNQGGRRAGCGRFKDEIVPVTIPQRKGDPIVFDTDEFVNRKTNAESAFRLKPAFDKSGSVTAGNASGINDGAAALLVMSADKAKALGLKPLARIVSFALRRCRSGPDGHGSGARVAQGHEKSWLKAEQLDLMELNEAFAAQACAVLGPRLGQGAVQGQDQRQRRRDRAGTPDRRIGRARAGDAAARNEAARREEGTRGAVSVAAWASRLQWSDRPSLQMYRGRAGPSQAGCVDQETRPSVCATRSVACTRAK